LRQAPDDVTTESVVPPRGSGWAEWENGRMGEWGNTLEMGLLADSHLTIISLEAKYSHFHGKAKDRPGVQSPDGCL